MSRKERNLERSVAETPATAAEMVEAVEPKVDSVKVEASVRQRGFGFRAAPADPRDQHFGARIGSDAAEPPPSFSNRDLVTNVLDQLTVESCIANAGAAQLSCEFARLGIDAPAISRLFCYFGLRAIAGDQYQDVGGYVRNFYVALNRFGFCAERTFPYSSDPAVVNAQPTERAYMEAFANHVKVGYYRIDFGDMTIGALSNLQYARKRAIQQALSRRHTVAFGTAVDVDALPKYRGTGLIEAPDTSAKVAGHAMLMVAYDEEGVTVLNSWGTGWGDGGFGKLSWSYILDARTSDLWVLELESAPKFYGGQK